MKTKMFEILDKGLCIPVIAIKMDGDNKLENEFFNAGGWCKSSVMLINTDGKSDAKYDPFKWRDEANNTLFEAHRYIEQYFDKLPNFSTIDVQYILGKSKAPNKTNIWIE